MTDNNVTDVTHRAAWKTMIHETNLQNLQQKPWRCCYCCLFGFVFHGLVYKQID